jgi:two-component system, NarL family, response regulator NreC
MLRILLCDDHRLMREGLRAILEKAGLEVVGEAENGRQGVELARQLHPDVVLMDISMPDLNGIDATRLMVEERPAIKVIGLSMNSDRRYVVTMFSAGAVGYLLKSAASEELIRAVEAVTANLKYVSPAVAGTFIDDYVAQAAPSEFLANEAPAAAPKPLSLREREVLQLLAEGKSSKEIATRLSIAATTVESHRRQIMDKLNIRTIAELTKYAVREGLTTLE